MVLRRVVTVLGLLLVSLPAIGALASFPLFADGFESGDMSSWTKSVDIVVEQTDVHNGSWAARATVAGARAYAYETLATPQADIYCRVWFEAFSHATKVTLIRVRAATGGSIVSVGLTPTGKLYTNNGVTAVTTTSSTAATDGVWHQLEFHASIADTSSQLEVWLDGVSVPKVTKTDTLGTIPVGRVEIGEGNTGRTFDVAFDDVAADPAFIDTSAPTTPGGLAATSVFSNHVTLDWAPSIDDFGVSGYTVHRDGDPIGTVDGATTTFTDTTVSPTTDYNYTVEAFDGVGNPSAQSDPPLPITTPAADATPPTVPMDVTASVVESNEVELTWTASSDDVGVIGYTIYRDGNPVGTVDGATTGYADDSVSPSTTYDYTVDAFDGDGNHSTPSDPPLEVTTPTPDPVIAAAGDIACDPAAPKFNGGAGARKQCQELYTSDLLTGSNVAAVLALGDDQYWCGGYQAFLQSYGPSWGRVIGITYPVPGNHEYLSTANSSNGTDCSPHHDAAGYFTYFGSAAGDPSQGWYSFDVGTWHIIALNAECSYVGGCGPASPQGAWLTADLVAHPNLCTLAFWHQPRFSSGPVGSNTSYASFWDQLYGAGADVVLNGHSHNYERFAPQTPAQVPDPSGIREFVVGTGGVASQPFGTTIEQNSEVRKANAFGVLELTLHPDGYDWTFVPVAGGAFTDSGSGTCH